MEKAIYKANILVEALPYIKQFHKAIFVIKYGGSILEDTDARESVLEDIAFLRYAGIRPVLIHGGGPHINKRLKEINHPIKFENGLRVTDKTTLNIVIDEMETLNKALVKEINRHGNIAKGYTHENCLVSAEKKTGDVDLGFVGNAVEGDLETLEKTLENSVPVIVPLGISPDGTLYNINADDVACFIASRLNAEKLVLMTKELGVLRDPSDSSTLIHSIKVNSAEKLIEDKIVTAGMVPKIRASVQSINEGVRKVHIVDAKIPHALLLEIFTDKGIGTEITI